jgi:cytochrome oxidase assembly protein ShyY1
MAIVFAVACFFLSRWQFGRNAQTLAANSVLQTNYSARAVAPAKVLPTKTSWIAAYEWRKVDLVGHYLPSKQLLVRDRVSGDNPGFEVLTPFRMTSGSIFIVDRGWVALGTKQEYPDFIPPAPTTLEHVTARIQQSESILPGRVAPKGEISEINVPKMLSLDRMSTSNTYTGAYGLLASETPTPPSRPVAAAKPIIDNGPFLSYAFQWILFALMGFGALGLALRSEYRIRNAEDPVVRAHAAERERKASLRPRSDSEIEDGQIAEAGRRESELEDANL